MANEITQFARSKLTKMTATMVKSRRSLTCHHLKRLFGFYVYKDKQQAGHPCRPALDMYKEVDLLKLFVARVVRNGPLTAIPLENIQSKAVFVCVNGVFYAIKPPNSYEHH